VLIEPRDQILDIWRSVAGNSFRGGKWQWGGDRERNSISDAEQLLCILYPATQIPQLRLDDIDEVSDDALNALRPLGNDVDVIRRLLEGLVEYMEEYRDEDGRPTFTAGSYLDPLEPDLDEPGPTREQLELELVDAFSMSVTLSLATVGFLQVLRGGVSSRRTIAQIEHLNKLASERLTAAMTGLLRSFSVNVFEVDDPAGRNLCSMINQGSEPDRIVAERFSRSLRDIRTRLREEVTIGSGLVKEELENENRLFECGWSWGIVKDAGKVELVGDEVPQRAGVAEDRPYLYFTGVALDGIEDLFTSRTRILGLLDDTQQRLASSLQLRWELCTEFWNRAATFGTEQWAVEDVPWTTTDGVTNDYFTLFVVSMVVQRMAGERQAGERTQSASLGRVARLLEELASRGRITRRPLEGEVSLSLHAPGARLRLVGTEELGPRQSWVVSNYSALLLKRTLATVGLTADTAQRRQLTVLSDRLWDHLQQRRLGEVGTGQGLWDQPANVLPVAKRKNGSPSWYHTQRVVECLVVGANLMQTDPRVSAELVDQVGEFLAEAEHLFDQEKLKGTPNAGQSIRDIFESIAARLERSRELESRKPATALVLAQDVLRDLETISTARRSSTSVTPL
jgi:hypothetical protein